MPALVEVLRLAVIKIPSQHSRAVREWLAGCRREGIVRDWKFFGFPQMPSSTVRAKGLG